MIKEIKPQRGNAGGDGHLLAVHHGQDRSRIKVAPGHDQRAARHRHAKGIAPGIDVEHRHHRHDAIDRTQAGDVTAAQHQGMYEDRAMGIKRPLGPPRCPRGIAQPGGGTLVEARPGRDLLGSRNQGLIAQQRHAVRQRRRGHLGLRAHDDDGAHDIGNLRRDGLKDRDKAGIGEDHAVFGVIDDIGNIGGGKARIDGVVDRADARNGVVQFKMAIAVHRQGGDPVAVAHTKLAQHRRQSTGAARNRGVGRAGDAVIIPDRDHFAIAVIARRMIQNRREQQLPVLHQSQHSWPRPLVT